MVSRIVVKPETTRHRHADPSVQKEQLLKNPINKPYLCLVGRVPNDALKRLAKFQETALFSFRQTLAAVDRALPDLTPDPGLRSYMYQDILYNPFVSVFARHT